jgi:hypothetical protein
MAFDHAAAAAYARKWVDPGNPAYPPFENDCTSFVSQTMLAGGWEMIGGDFRDRTRDDVWWYGESHFTRASYTWGGAANFARFITSSKRGARELDLMKLDVGDVVQIKFADDDHIGHSMVITKKSTTDLFLSYHSVAKLDEPLSAIRARNGGAEYFGWRINP